MKHQKIEAGIEFCKNDLGAYTSQGEYCIAKVLQYMGWDFITEFYLDPKNKKTSPRFDFYFIYKNQEFLIEYNGYQHFGICDYSPSIEDLKAQRKRDKMKRKWAKSKGYKIINFNVRTDSREYTKLYNETRITPTKIFSAVEKLLKGDRQIIDIE